MHQDLSEKEKTKCQYACGWHRNLSEEQKNKKQKYGWEQYKNLPEDERQSLVECRKNYAKMRKKNCFNKDCAMFLAMQAFFGINIKCDFLEVSVLGKYKSILEIAVLM